MKLVSTQQIGEEAIRASDFDAFIGASGYEARATHAFTKLRMQGVDQKRIFGFSDRPIGHRRTNDAIFAASDASVTQMDGNSAVAAREAVSELIAQNQSKHVKLFVDYSSMTRVWYAGVIEAIVASEKECSCVFAYSPAKFSLPSSPTPNAIVGPIAGFCSLDVPEKPSALIIGLGYERERALGIFEYIDPGVAFAFYTDPAIDDRYTTCVVRNNTPLLRLLGRDNIFRHPLMDLQRTSALLVSLYSALAEEYRVILAPLGIKPFSLLCLLLSSRFLDVDVWRISPGEKAPMYEREPAGPLLALKAEFGQPVTG